MSNDPRQDEYWASRMARIVGGALCGVFLGLLASACLLPSDDLASGANWTVVFYPAAGAALFTLIVVVFGSSNISLPKAVLGGMLIGVVIVGILQPLVVGAWIELVAGFLGGMVGLAVGLRRRALQRRMASGTAPKRGRWQFSVRTMLLFTALVSVGVWLWTYHERQQAIARVATAGGLVKWFPELTALHLRGSAVTDERLSDLAALEHLDTLSISYALKLTDDGIQHLSRLHSLRGLDIDNTPITDEGMAYLGRLPALESLGLHVTPATDEGLRQISQMRELRKLVLDFTNVTDAGLVHLRNLPRLESLSISRAPISDAGLVHVGEMKQLQTLQLYFTSITDVGLVHVSHLTELRQLYLINTPAITDAGLLHLDGLSELRHLRVFGAGITKDGIRRQREKFPQRDFLP